ncbi:uncharacterized protein CDAR_622741 [Caerostris darwini]|uniref:Uncharacterized protein n=1 Tax=Caerostris darwini TaxID=1538125 RepID=A0AAV4TF85_9ARAC|nr:uncharacterized protein CDAR_622741 [Caerostris darwini]
MPGTCDCTVDYPEEGDTTLECEDGSLRDLKKSLKLFRKTLVLNVILTMMEFPKYLPSKLFRGWYIESLSLYYTDLKNLSEEGQVPLAGLEDTLKVLIIESCFDTNDPNFKLNLGHLRVIEHLDISENVITKLGDEWFENGPTSLTTLYMHNNSIEIFGNRSFANLVDLMYVSISGNYLERLQRSMLPKPANMLLELFLEDNEIHDVPKDMFTKMPILRHLSLRNNMIRKMPYSTYKPVWKTIQSINMLENPIACDSNNWLLNVPSSIYLRHPCISEENEGNE